MWKCQNCNAEVEEDFEICWQCQVARDEPGQPGAAITSNLLACLRCSHELKFVGTGCFANRTKWGVWRFLSEVFMDNENFEIYSCETCGHAELFLESIGRGRRPQ